MTPSLTLSLFTIILALASVAMNVRTRRVYRARVAELENEIAARRLAEQLRRAFAARLAAQAGADLVEPIPVADIKFGDKVCWHPRPPDHSKRTLTMSNYLAWNWGVDPEGVDNGYYGTGFWTKVEHPTTGGTK